MKLGKNPFGAPYGEMLNTFVLNESQFFTVLDPPESIRAFALFVVSKEVPSQAHIYGKEFNEIIKPIIKMQEDNTFYEVYEKKNPNMIQHSLEKEIKTLIIKAQSHDIDVSENGIEALAKIGKPVIKYAVEYLKSFKNTGDVWKAAITTEILGRIGGIEAVDPLIKLLEYEHLYRDASEALVEIGEPAVEMLLKKLNDNSEDEELHQLISQILKKIGYNFSKPDVNKNTKLLIDQGNAKFKSKKYNESIMDFNKVIELNPNNTNAYYYRGVAKGQLKDYKGAIFDFSQIIKLKPNYSDGYNFRGHAKLKFKDNKGAIVDFTKAIELNPMDAKSYHYRGLAKMVLNDIKNGKLDLKKAIELGYKKHKT